MIDLKCTDVRALPGDCAFLIDDGKTAVFILEKIIDCDRITLLCGETGVNPVRARRREVPKCARHIL